MTFRRCLRVYDEQRRFAPVFDDDDVATVAVRHGADRGRAERRTSAFLDDGGGDVEQMRPGWPKVDPDTLATTAPGVFVAGDLAHGTRLLIDAVASGKKAARSIYRHVTGRALHADALTAHLPLRALPPRGGLRAIRRVPVPVARTARAPGCIRTALVELGYDREAALREASRCLDCGVTPVFDGTRCVLCGGCVDVCPTQCLKLVSLDTLDGDAGARSR